MITELHEKAVLETLSQKTATTPEQVSTVLGDLLSIDFGSLSWSEVFTLRKSGFANDYRDRVAEWALAHQDSDIDLLTSSLNTFIRDSVFELIGDTEPNLRETILSGIGGNLPSPIIVNPISMFSAARDAKKAHSLKSKYGWLYFVQRGHAAAKRNAK